MCGGCFTGLTHPSGKRVRQLRIGRTAVEVLRYNYVVLKGVTVPVISGDLIYEMLAQTPVKLFLVSALAAVTITFSVIVEATA